MFVLRLKRNIKNQSAEMERLSFKAGDVIQDYCDPFIKLLFASQKGTRCDECFNEQNLSNLQRCSGCQLMYYCDKKCQRKDWGNGHKLECKSQFFRNTDPPNTSRFTRETLPFKFRILRLCAFLTMRPEAAVKKVKVYDGSSRCFNNLMSHEDEMAQDGQVVQLCTEILNELKNEGSLIATADGFNIEYILRLAGIFRTNAFCIYNDEKTEGIGTGLFIETSVFDHSCKPTAFFVMKGSKMQIRAIASIPPGESPFVSYLLAHKGRSERQKTLQQRYNFECRCERCEAEKVAGDLINYNRLEHLQRSAHEIKDWTMLVCTHNDLIGLMRKIYHEYDERITNQIHWMFTRGIELRGSTDDLKEIAKEAKIHLLATFGSEYHDYLKFEKSFKEFQRNRKLS